MTRSRRSPAPARWALQDAKNRLSEVVDGAVRGQPQIVTRRGVETAVIISRDEYARMTEAREAVRPPFTEYLLGGFRLEDTGELFDRIDLRPRRRP